MNNIVSMVNEYILKRGVSYWPLTTEYLKKLCELEGYKVFSYSEGKEIIDTLGISEHCKQPAFLYKNKEFKFIFYTDSLMASERNCRICHELMHVILNQGTQKGSQPLDAKALEEEAKIASLQLLAPVCIVKHLGLKSVDEIEKRFQIPREYAEHIYSKTITYENLDLAEQEIVNRFTHAFFQKVNHVGWKPTDPLPDTPLLQLPAGIQKEEQIYVEPGQGKKRESLKLRDILIVAIVLMAIVVVGVMYFYFEYRANSAIDHTSRPWTELSSVSPPSDIESNSSVIDYDAIVYVSETGEKFHTISCYYITKIAKTPIASMTMRQALDKGLEPCSHCYQALIGRVW